MNLIDLGDLLSCLYTYTHMYINTYIHLCVCVALCSGLPEVVPGRLILAFLPCNPILFIQSCYVGKPILTGR